MNPFLEIQMLTMSNPELMALQQKINKETENMSQIAKCMYLEELMLDNCQQLKEKLKILKELDEKK